jgi:hypothetical protein
MRGNLREDENQTMKTILIQDLSDGKSNVCRIAKPVHNRHRDTIKTDNEIASILALILELTGRGVDE